MKQNIFFQPGVFFFVIFFEFSKKIIFLKVLHDYDSTYYLGVLWFPSYPKIIMQNFLLQYQKH